MKAKKLPLIPFLALLTACLPQGVRHHELRTLPQDGWRRHDTVTFSLDSTQADGMMYLCLRVDKTMYYDTLWLCVNGDTVGIAISTLHGAALPQGEVPLQHAHPGTYQITHLMRQEPLHGVREVGIKVATASTQCEK